MKMNTYLMNIDKILRFDDELWKLMYYRSTNSTDDPLDKESIFDLDMTETAKIINHRLKYTPTIDDLDDDKICRIIFIPAIRRPQRQNYMVADQDIDIEIFVHQEFNDGDMRLAKICDRINDLLSDKRVSGMGKMRFINGKPFTLRDKGYIGYTLTYRFGSGSV